MSEPDCALREASIRKAARKEAFEEAARIADREAYANRRSLREWAVAYNIYSSLRAVAERS